jgi:hypothetical protein
LDRETGSAESAKPFLDLSGGGEVALRAGDQVADTYGAPGDELC